MAIVKFKKKNYKVNMKKKTLQGITPCKIILQVKDLELEEIQLKFIIITTKKYRICHSFFRMINLTSKQLQK